MSTYAYRQAAGIRQALLDRRELALIDVREEADFATAHPLFAVNLPLSKLELEVRRRIPRFTTPLTVYDNGEGLAEIAIERLRSWGYQDVALLAEGLAGWRRSGGELFQDVNSASKAFGELVESVRHTPSLSAQEVQALIDSRQEVVIVDARRFDEYQTMSIPGSISVPAASWPCG
ncbi:Rhodanese-related sulfurtransferase [Klebsiella pneumoniae]|nr:Rhodanese-related sulfurtransferase [Klebsiella pneumoniae]